MYNLKNYVYTCTACNQQWNDSRDPEFAAVPTKFPCPHCSAKAEITYEERAIEKCDAPSSIAVIDPTKLAGVIKKPDWFKDQLKRVAKHHPHNQLNID